MFSLPFSTPLEFFPRVLFVMPQSSIVFIELAS